MFNTGIIQSWVNLLLSLCCAHTSFLELYYPHVSKTFLTIPLYIPCREVSKRIQIRTCWLFRKWEDVVLGQINDSTPFIVTVLALSILYYFLFLFGVRNACTSLQRVFVNSQVMRPWMVNEMEMSNIFMGFAVHTQWEASTGLAWCLLSQRGWERNLSCQVPVRVAPRWRPFARLPPNGSAGDLRVASTMRGGI